MLVTIIDGAKATIKGAYARWKVLGIRIEENKAQAVDWDGPDGAEIAILDYESKILEVETTLIKTDLQLGESLLRELGFEAESLLRPPVLRLPRMIIFLPLLRGQLGLIGNGATGS
jgi:hypothetical protein